MMLLAASGFASTVRKMELPDLVRNSDSIVQGRVEQVYTRWDEKLKVAFTFVSVYVDDPLKGARRRTVLIQLLGGKVGSLVQTVAGMPRFNRGDAVIVFLKDRNNGSFEVVGMNQGKYDIVNDFAVANVSGVTLVDPKTGQLSEARFVDKAPLEEFKAKIRELVR
jgi:hypothetical protein